MAGIHPSVTVWIDTNVMHEIMGQGDLFRDFVKGPAKVEERRMRLQGALWFATALDAEATVTACYGHEVAAGTERLAKIGTGAGTWTAVAVQLLRPHVFPQWQPSWTDDGQVIFDDPTKGVRKRGAELDALIVQRCTERSLILVTRDDKGTIGEARASGSITVLTPEEYAAARLSRGQARQRFMERLGIGAIHRIVDATPEARQRTIEEMKVIVGTYRSAWQDPRVRPTNGSAAAKLTHPATPKLTHPVVQY
jgi:hypothetical protein